MRFCYRRVLGQWITDWNSELKRIQADAQQCSCEISGRTTVRSSGSFAFNISGARSEEGEKNGKYGNTIHTNDTTLSEPFQSKTGLLRTNVGHPYRGPLPSSTVGYRKRRTHARKREISFPHERNKTLDGNKKKSSRNAHRINERGYRWNDNM